MGFTILAGWLAGFYYPPGNYNEPLGQFWIYKSYEWAFAFLPDRPIKEAVVIFADHFSHEELQQPYQRPWDRNLHAQLIRRLDVAGAKVIVMDYLLIDQAPEDANQALKEAIDAHGTVLLASNFAVNPENQRRIYNEPTTFLDTSATIGHANLVEHPSYGVIRHQFERRSLDGTKMIEPISLLAARLAGAKVESGSGHNRWMNYYLRPPKTFSTLPYAAVVNPHDGGSVLDLDELKAFCEGKTVFVGEEPTHPDYAGALKDVFRTPYTAWTQLLTPGVVIHATSFENFVQGDWLRRLPITLEWILMVAWGIGCVWSLEYFRPHWATLSSLLAVLGIAWLSYVIVRWTHYWYPWLVLAGIQLPIAYTIAILRHSLKLFGEKQKLQQSLQLHLSSSRVRQILKRGELLKPGGEKMEVSILFSDIANFSQISGRMDPDDLFKLLNKYFEQSLTCIHATQGTVVKLIGDAIFSIWNAPFPQKHHGTQACIAALNLRNQLVRFDVQQKSLPLRTRVGLHTGPAIVGNVGSSQRFDYTAIGDSINLASRLEGLNKFIGTDILATRDIQKGAETDVVSRIIGYFRFKGFDRFVEVHELIDLKVKEEESEEWRRSFEKALFHFQRQKFDEARRGFEETLDKRPGDGPSRYYLGHVEDLVKDPPPLDWAGEIKVDEK